MELVDPDGLKVRGVICFDKARMSGNDSGWYAKFQEEEISEGEPLKHDDNTHLCFKCRENIKPHLTIVGQRYKEECPFCDTHVMYPMSPP